MMKMKLNYFLIYFLVFKIEKVLIIKNILLLIIFRTLLKRRRKNSEINIIDNNNNNNKIDSLGKKIKIKTNKINFQEKNFICKIKIFKCIIIININKNFIIIIFNYNINKIIIYKFF